MTLQADIQAKEPERQAIADAVSAFKANGGKPEVLPSYQMSTYVPTWNNRARAEAEQHKAAKPVKREPKKPTRYEQEMASVDKLNAEIDALFERLKSKEKKNDN